jgi:multidrug efflux pump subunit AcrB
MRSHRSGPGGDNLSISLSGNDVTILKQASTELTRILSEIDHISDINDSLPYDKQEKLWQLNPLGQSLGISEGALAQELRYRLQAIELLEFAEQNQLVKVFLSLPEEERYADFLDHSYYFLDDGRAVALSDIVAEKRQNSFASLSRENGVITISITGDIISNDSKLYQAIQERIETEILPQIAQQYDVTWQLTGLKQQEREFLNDAIISFALCFLGIYLCLVWVFSSFLLPFIIILIVPFGAIGMVWGHFWHDVPLSMFSVIGFIGMAGIIINDAIILLTTIQQYEVKMPAFRAVITALGERLRPIFLTTATTVLGLIPLLLEDSRQAQFLLPSVITLVYGLGFGMILLLIITPACYLFYYEWRLSQKSLYYMIQYWIKKRKAIL